MAVVFQQIGAEKDISEKESFGTIVISALLILGLGIVLLRSIELHPLIVSAIMLALLWGGRPLTRKLYPDWAKTGDIVGELSFEESRLEYLHNGASRSIAYSDIAAIQLHYNYIQGRQYAARDIIHNGLAEILISTKEDEHLSIKFLIENEEQLEKLKPVWTSLYRKGIRMRERMGRHKVKTIMFEANVSYQKLQNLKEELHCQDFYSND